MESIAVEMVNYNTRDYLRESCKGSTRIEAVALLIAAMVGSVCVFLMNGTKLSFRSVKDHYVT